MFGHWWHEFGDNDVLGWATTAAYFLVAALCFRAARRLRRTAPPETPRELAPAVSPRSPRATARDWAIIGAGMILLGLNKQLDLQILARDTGIAVVKALGFDAQRRWVGRLMFVGLSAVILVALAKAARHLRAARRGHNLTLWGLGLLACFLIVRAAGFQPYFRTLNLRFKDLIHVVFEVGGLVLVGLSAFRASARRPPPQFEHQ